MPSGPANPSRRRAMFGLAAITGMLQASSTFGQSAQPPIIAAASGLQFVLPDLLEGFEARTGTRPRLVLGASGNLLRQIRQGAPFDIFLSADVRYAEAIQQAGLSRGPARAFAQGQLALFIPHGSQLKGDPRLDGIAEALSAGSLTHFAIASPEHAPFGARAREALQHRGLWTAIEPHLVYGENVAQAAQFAASGNAQGGLIANALARSPSLQPRGAAFTISPDWHAPLTHALAVLSTAIPASDAFVRYLLSDTGARILSRGGFTPLR